MDLICVNLVYMDKLGIMLDQGLVSEDDKRLQLIRHPEDINISLKIIDYPDGS